MDLFGLGFVAEKFQRPEEPERKKRRADERKCDIHGRRGDGSEREQVQEKTGSKRRHRRMCRLPAGKFIRTFQNVIESRLRFWRRSSIHYTQLFASPPGAGRIGMRKLFSVGKPGSHCGRSQSHLRSMNACQRLASKKCRAASVF